MPVYVHVCVCGVCVCMCVCVIHSQVGGYSGTHTINTAAVVVDNMTIIDMRHTKPDFEDFMNNSPEACQSMKRHFVMHTSELLDTRHITVTILRHV